MSLFKIIMFCSILPLLMFTGCNRGSHPAGPADQLSDEFLLMHSRKCGVEAGFIYDDVVIEELALDGNLLRINVMYGGGCKTHCFSVVWDKVIINSDPPSVVLALLHNGNKDMCEALINENILFPINPLVKHLSQQGLKQVYLVIQYGNKLSERVVMNM